MKHIKLNLLSAESEYALIRVRAHGYFESLYVHTIDVTIDDLLFILARSVIISDKLKSNL